jgi:import receptor subunit TOM70
MPAEPVSPVPAHGVSLNTASLSSQTGSSGLWDRISTWASENKAVVCTIAGVAVVITGAGVVYYLSDSKSDTKADAERRASKKERRKAKKGKDAADIEKQASSTLPDASGQYLHLSPLRYINLPPP